MASPMDEVISCDDFNLFQDTLRKSRLIDDRIINALNCSLPTESFKNKNNPEQTCKNFYDELHTVHSQRQRLITNCVTKASESISELRERKNASSGNSNGLDDPVFIQELRKQQMQLRMMQSELSVEEVVRDRSLKVFYERCRTTYLPPGFRLS